MYLAIILIYLAAVFAIGIYFSKNAQNSKSFLSAKGQISWYVNAGTLIATYVGSGAIMGGASLAFASGYNAIWLYAGGWLAILAHVLLYKKIKKLSGSTVSELIGNRYGDTARLISALIIMVAETSIVGYNLKSIGVIINTITGMNVNIAAVIATIFIILITVVAGLVSVAYTDYVQSIIIIVSFIIAIPAIINAGGGLSNIISRLPTEYFNPLGSFGGISYILSSMLPTFCLVFMSQSFWQRFAAAGSKKDLLKTVITWLIGVVTISLLIITFATFGKAAAPDATGDSIVIYLAKNILPTLLGILILVATTSILVTTADSYLLASTSVFMNDLYNRYINKNADEKKKLLVSRISVVVFGIISFVLVTFFPTILSMVYFAYTMEGGLIVAMIGILFWKRATPQGGVAAIATVFVVTILWEIFKPFGIATIFATLISGTAVLVIVSLLTPPPEQKYIACFEESGDDE